MLSGILGRTNTSSRVCVQRTLFHLLAEYTHTPKGVLSQMFFVAFGCLIIFPGHMKRIYLPKNGFLHP